MTKVSSSLGTPSVAHRSQDASEQTQKWDPQVGTTRPDTLHLSVLPSRDDRPSKRLKVSMDAQAPAARWAASTPARGLEPRLLRPAIDIPPNPVETAILLGEMRSVTDTLPDAQRTALWVAALKTMPAQCTQVIGEEMAHDGFAHVVWGSKPAYYLESGQESGLYPHIAKISKQYGLSDKFALVPVSLSARRGADGKVTEGPSGWLVNVQQMRGTIARERDWFTRFLISDGELHEHLKHPPSELDDELYKRLMQRLPNIGYRGMDANLEASATLLGFGRSNGAAFARAGGGPPQGGLHERVRENLEQRLSALRSGPACVPGLPNFWVFDEAETHKLVDRYVAESAAIHDRLGQVGQLCKPPVDDPTTNSWHIEVAHLLDSLTRRREPQESVSNRP
ncbi:hypothetical protein DFQ28_009316 [Apophysomyces sp. BC1034]|nr:hypothetical protein DFQ28_009316 [Apophysomyces sp. BC1034]